MSVAILGCGPSGLIAAYAAEELGHNVHIYSQRVRSQMFGAMYLHEPIPGASPEEPELVIDVVKIGTREGYALNVYGDASAPVSWDKFPEGPTPGWDLKRVYNALYNRYEGNIIDVSLTSAGIHEIAKGYDKTFSTIPIKKICENWHHSFRELPIWVVHGEAPGENTMVYNGIDTTDADQGWYRYSLINDYQSWEYSTRHSTNYLEAHPGDHLQVSEGMKPLSTDCDCHPEIVRLGRYGKWNKNAFTHHAYAEVQSALQ